MKKTRIPISTTNNDPLGNADKKILFMVKKKLTQQLFLKELVDDNFNCYYVTI